MSGTLSEIPAVFQYQRALSEFRRGRVSSEGLVRRMSELISLLDFTTTLSSGLSSDEILDAALLVVIGELGASRAALLTRGEDGLFRLRAARGVADQGDSIGPMAAPVGEAVLFRSELPDSAVFDAYGIEVLCPVAKAGKVIAALGIGPRVGGAPFGAEEVAFLRSVAACAAAPIENGLINAELRRVNRRLQAKLFQLQNLFDLGRELTSSFDEDSIKNVVTGTLMGHLMVSRCALYLLTEEGFEVAQERGLRGGEEAALVPDPAARAAVVELQGATPAALLPEGPLRDRLERCRLGQVVPIWVGDRVQAVFAVGERASGAALGEEDQDFVMALGRQALAALESVRLHRVRVAKERQDRELQIAREIQRSLFPASRPTIPGFEVAALSRPCYEVGGDYFDYIPIGGGRLALTIADVSGKGTPASLLMASVHASLQALAGTATPALLMERLNRFLFQNTQANKFVTLFYAELDPASRRLSYANAGHVPPYHVGSGGMRGRLSNGGPALGLLDEVQYEGGEVTLLPGDVITMVTDGATEAVTPDDRDFGDERVFETLAGASGEGAQGILDALIGAVTSWTGSAGCSDDLTVLVLKAL